ncbi:peptide ABC transporter [Micromonospora humidisoli]|uniref:ABC transporter permease n=2 Tax=Micromonospora TaxID=1873 RepID=A0ABS2IUQ8_9ACTN|nr:MULTISPECIES: ABC transporter permease [Micromonospora]MBM7076996.1 ABC transporter permease [Micromonospora humida]MBM7082549.1 ABC transporter permease [Micromonospora humidisoli]GHJ05880.1 peptide ABC transporter [Micromonospora sp. AKA109]
MFRFVLRRLLQMVLAFFGTTLIVYALMFAGQGDPIQALAGERPVTPAQRAYLTEKFHLDRTGVGGFLYRYLDYLKNLLQGDLGQSLTGRSIGDILAAAWPVTVKLALIAMAVTILFGVTAGVLAGIRRASLFDNATLVLTLLVLGIPTIVLAPLAQYLLGVRWPVFPPTAGADPDLWALLLPGIVLGSLSLATALRLTRTSVAENLRADYVRTARSKGLARRRIIGVHVLRNSLIPVITFLGVELGNLMSGAIITEGVFNIPGVGFNLFRGIRTEDGPLVVGIVSVLVVVYLVANLVVDVLYAVLDPRIRYE